jgi:GTPase SAR1 family protein
MLIALLGVRGSGKSTIANYLVDNYKFTSLSFAEKLKQVVSIAFDINLELLEGNSSESRVYRETQNEFWGMTPRQMLETVGTKLFRKGISEDFWVKIVEKRIIHLLSAGENVVISDLRFVNEWEMLKKYNVKVVFVDNGKQIDNEYEIGSIQYDIKIENQGITKEELYKEIEDKIENKIKIILGKWVPHVMNRKFSAIICMFICKLYAIDT